MFYSKTGFPEESEIVMCTVTNIQYSSVFVKIDDYNISGMIHISEIAAGRIRNIRDYVKEGKKVACKVLRINEARGHVDLSLRRVNESQRKQKVNEIKLEQKAESIIDYIARQNKIDTKKLYDEISGKLFKDYSYIHHAFEDVIAGHLSVSDFADKKFAPQMEELIRQRFTPKDIEISGVASLSTYEGNGIETIKGALTGAEKIKGVRITYLGGGKYRFSVTAPDYKEAEPKLKQASEIAVEYVLKHKGQAEFKRTEKK
ncbi:TPA: S1 RNA-binding domain-containing protein [Candidatus Woesearchaeota archaeon]|nr:Translation initiation factor 2 subunit alpha AeIF-2a [archaeon GW2011_AR15]MBS3104199.1 S1 RNA-binding domain-containing protein [Candidatus Woesearchaeota archaeon]HIH41971.1 S1 RNA-binding domain-containing protein [Candidatus Woesearchaeota archaeon]